MMLTSVCEAKILSKIESISLKSYFQDRLKYYYEISSCYQAFSKKVHEKKIRKN
jgi:hypothetical protein